MSSSIKFIMAALREPLQVSTLFQTSGFTVSRLLQPLKSDNHCSVLELGVGAGAVTRKIKKWLKDNSRYLGVEINPELCQYVKEEYPDFKFICGSAEILSEFAQGQKFDLIVSTLPWSLFDDFTRRSILDQVGKHLDTGGYFKTYTVCNALFTRNGKKFRQQLEDRFEVTAQWEVLNIPPALVFECRLKSNLISEAKYS